MKKKPRQLSLRQEKRKDAIELQSKDDQQPRQQEASGRIDSEKGDAGKMCQIFLVLLSYRHVLTLLVLTKCMVSSCSL